MFGANGRFISNWLEANRLERRRKSLEWMRQSLERRRKSLEWMRLSNGIFTHSGHHSAFTKMCMYASNACVHWHYPSLSNDTSQGTHTQCTFYILHTHTAVPAHQYKREQPSHALKRKHWRQLVLRMYKHKSIRMCMGEAKPYNHPAYTGGVCSQAQTLVHSYSCIGGRQAYIAANKVNWSIDYSRALSDPFE